MQRDWTRYSKLINYFLINITTINTNTTIKVIKIVRGAYMIIQEEIQGSLT